MAIRKKARTKHDNKERWLLTYSDLITLLMVFFVVLYSMSKADVAKFSKLSASLQRAFNIQVLEGLDPTAVGGEGGQFETQSPQDLETFRYGVGPGLSKADDFAAIQSDIEQFAKTKGLVGSVMVRENKEGIIITLSGNLLFDSAKAELKPQAVVALEKVAQIIKDRPNEIRVEGHTDNIPISTPLFPSNWELSTARAVSVAKYLTGVEGIAPDRIGAVGYGEYRPLVDNDTREHRALNRRVDILIIYPSSGAQIAPTGQTITPTSSIGR
ncbi:MAG: OmpA family protein [Chloroflexi bacterium]|nr:OmpA family protein [Chloroflexota bacterium]